MLSLRGVLMLALIVVCASHVNIILLGATGNLAKKYLWQALLSQVIKERMKSGSHSIYAGATRGAAEGSKIVRDSIAATSCEGLFDSDITPATAAARCDTAKNTLLQISQYVKLKEPAHFEALNGLLEAAAADRTADPETLRIYYLSITPSLYESTVLAISSVGRPHNSEVQMRVVFEKPFGKDLASATQLSSLLQKYLQEQEIYRVDHYLGKEGVKVIAEFRRNNIELLTALGLPAESPNSCEGAAHDNAKSSQLLSVVKVTLTETEDVAGRSGYFDEYGVIRDVMQNHMTQAAIYAMMPYSATHASSDQCSEMSPTGVSESVDECESDGIYGLLSHRMATIGKLALAPSRHSVAGFSRPWIGQYSEYRGHVQADLRDPHLVSSTPTAAAISLYFNASAADGDRASNCPESYSIVHFRGGKALRHREMSVTVSPGDEENWCDVTYSVQGGQGVGPRIVMRGECWKNHLEQHNPSIVLPRGWTVDTTQVPAAEGSTELMCNCNEPLMKATSEPSTGNDVPACTPDNTIDGCTIVPRVARSNNAYIQILEALLDNDRSMFVQTSELFAQWRLWDAVIDAYRVCTATESENNAMCALSKDPDCAMQRCLDAIQLYEQGLDISAL